MSSVITTDFERWKAQEAALGKPVALNEFVFANVPGLDPSKDISRDEKLPPSGQIVHRQAVNKAGLASENAVAYSVTLGTDVGDFVFNWIGLINKESGTLAMITHAPEQRKIKTVDGVQGNVLTRSFLLEFNGAAKETQITTSAETWQIDFTARLAGMDEIQRLANRDIYDVAAFFGDGFLVTKAAEQYRVTPGAAYIEGLRGTLEEITTFNNLRDTKIYADFTFQGNLVSKWQTFVKVTTAKALAHYQDAAGFKHYVAVIAEIDQNGNITDKRVKGTAIDRELAELKNTLPDTYLAKDQNGADIQNKPKFIENLGLGEAAKRGVQKTVTDNTDGVALIAGKAFGLGLGNVINPRPDPESFPPAGFYTDSADRIGLSQLPGGYVGLISLLGGTAWRNEIAMEKSGRMFIRGADGENIPSEKWYECYTENHKPSASDVGALPADGNAASATKLQTARTIGGVLFNGTTNINLPGVNISGNQNTSGNAATASKLQNARTINGVSFDGSANITISTTTGVMEVTGRWIDLSTGLLIQWGTQRSVGASPVQFNYGLAFSAIYGGLATIKSNEAVDGNNVAYFFTPNLTTGIVVNDPVTTNRLCDIFWLAIGKV